MSRYDEFREMFEKASPEEKLAILRSESIRLLTRASGYSSIMHELVEERKPSELPDKFGIWCQDVVDSINEFRDLIDALTDEKHRTVLNEERTKREGEFREMLWKGDQQRLPELQNYASLKNAIEKTANQMGISLSAPDIKIDDHIGSVYYFGNERRAHIGAQKSQYQDRYLGYRVMLELLKDKRNLEWQENEGLAPSFEEAITVLYLWLVKNHDLKAIQEKYPWMTDGRIRLND